MESGDYMRWVLQTTNHITYAYGNLLEMHKCCLLFMYQGLQQTLWRNRSGINLLSVKTLTGVCASSQFNTAESDTHHHFTAVCLYMRLDDDLQ